MATGREVGYRLNRYKRRARALEKVQEEEEAKEEVEAARFAKEASIEHQQRHQHDGGDFTNEGGGVEADFYEDNDDEAPMGGGDDSFGTSFATQQGKTS